MFEFTLKNSSNNCPSSKGTPPQKFIYYEYYLLLQSSVTLSIPIFDFISKALRFNNKKLIKSAFNYDFI